MSSVFDKIFDKRALLEIEPGCFQSEEFSETSGICIGCNWFEKCNPKCSETLK